MIKKPDQVEQMRKLAEDESYLAIILEETKFREYLSVSWRCDELADRECKTSNQVIKQSISGSSKRGKNLSLIDDA